MARPEIIKTELGKRLRAARGDLDRDTWASLLDVSKSTIAHYERGDRVPDALFLKRLSRAKVDVSWVVTGERQSSKPMNISMSASADFAFVPRLDVIASAGNGAITISEETEGMLAFRSDWLRDRGINPKMASALTVAGDSMEPVIRDGDILLVDRSIDRVRDNGIYVVVIGGLLVVKRVHTGMDGSVTLISENDVYPKETICANEVNDLIFAGRVMWFGRSI